MSFGQIIDSAYACTRLSPAEEAALACQRADCDSPADATEPCSRCGDRFCPDHLFDGLCGPCDAVDVAADALLAGRAA